MHSLTHPIIHFIFYQSTPLEDSFKFSFMRRGKAAQVAAATKEGEAPTTDTTTPHVVHPYENSIKTVAVVKTVEDFWNVYDYLKRPSDLPTTTDYHFFRAHIKPTWEDESNEKGGKWIVRLPKGMSVRVLCVFVCLRACLFVSLNFELRSVFFFNIYI